MVKEDIFVISVTVYFLDTFLLLFSFLTCHNFAYKLTSASRGSSIIAVTVNVAYRRSCLPPLLLRTQNHRLSDLTEAREIGCWWGMRCRCERVGAGFTVLVSGMACGLQICSLEWEVVGQRQEVGFDANQNMTVNDQQWMKKRKWERDDLNTTVVSDPLVCQKWTS